MHSTYGKPVDYLLIAGSKTCVRLSTHVTTRLQVMTEYSVQSRFIPSFTPSLSQYISPSKIAPPPPIEYIFYPVSTGPTNSNYKEKIKER